MLTLFLFTAKLTGKNNFKIKAQNTIDIENHFHVKSS